MTKASANLRLAFEPKSRESYELRNATAVYNRARLLTRLCVNGPSPVIKTHGLAVIASRITPTPSLYFTNETILLYGSLNCLFGPEKYIFLFVIITYPG